MAGEARELYALGEAVLPSEAGILVVLFRAQCLTGSKRKIGWRSPSGLLR